MKGSEIKLSTSLEAAILHTDVTADYTQISELW